MEIKSIKADIAAGRHRLVRASVNGCSAIAPKGTSKGRHEMQDIPAEKAVRKINNFSELIGNDFTQQEFDNAVMPLQGSSATTALSMAFCRAEAKEKGKEVYEYIAGARKSIRAMPLMNMVEGGRHARNALAIQEFLAVPKAKKFRTAFDYGKRIYNELNEITVKRFGSAALGMEYGLAPQLSSTQEAIELLISAIDAAGSNARVGIDAAASEFFSGRYKIDGRTLSKGELLCYYDELAASYPIIYIEDPFHEEDFKSFAELHKLIGKRVMVTGDDLLATNTARLKMAIRSNACNAAILKINQIGSVSKALEFARLAKKNRIEIVVSHRSVEGSDSFIADFAVGIGAHYIKAGAPAGTRLVKYRRLLEIENHLR